MSLTRISRLVHTTLSKMTTPALPDPASNGLNSHQLIPDTSSKGLNSFQLNPEEPGVSSKLMSTKKFQDFLCSAQVRELIEKHRLASGGDGPTPSEAISFTSDQAVKNDGGSKSVDMSEHKISPQKGLNLDAYLSATEISLSKCMFGRMEEKKVQTLVQRYESSGKPAILLVSNVHIASKEYFSEISKILATCTIAFMEGVTGCHSTVFDIQKLLAEKAGLFVVTDCITKSDNHKNVDCKFDDCDDATHLIPDMFTMLKPRFDALEGSTLRRIISTVVMSTFFGDMLDETGLFDWLGKTRDKQLQQALEQELKIHSHDKVIGICYGKAHMKPLHAWLIANGFVATEQRWLTAFEL